MAGVPSQRQVIHLSIPSTLPAILLAAILNSRIAWGNNNEKSKV
jgi:hypothetical protein